MIEKSLKIQKLMAADFRAGTTLSCIYTLIGNGSRWLRVLFFCGIQKLILSSQLYFFIVCNDIVFSWGIFVQYPNKKGNGQNPTIYLTSLLPRITI